MWKIVKYSLQNIIRNKIILSYAAFLLVICSAIFVLDDNATRGISSIMSISLIATPLVSVVFSSIFLYNNSEFIELLVAQPLKRKSILLANYVGVALALCLAFLTGVGIPVAAYAPTPAGLILVITGMLLTLIFASIAFLVSVIVHDKAKGIGAVLLLWFLFSVIYDSLIMVALFFLSDYPVDKPLLAFISLNPIDLGRISVMLMMDTSALMGFTGALYKNVFGSAWGMAVAVFLMMLWIILPLIRTVHVFNKKNL